MTYGYLIRLAQARLFWQLRRLLRTLTFWSGKRVFSARYRVRSARRGYGVLRTLVRLTLNTLIVASGFAILLQYVDPYMHPYYKAAGISLPADAAYMTFLATVSSIGAIFIGLYYTAISAVGSSIYATVPNNVRDLLAKERYGTVYMGLLAFVTFLGLALMVLHFSGFPAAYIAIPVVALLSGIGIIAFAKLGQRAFYFFDPTSLSFHVFDQLRGWLRLVQAGGYRWTDLSFQAHAHRQEMAALESLEALANVTAESAHLSGKPLCDLAKNVLGFLAYYATLKNKIPTESFWYEQRPSHREWYRTDDSQLSIAHNTGTALQPESVADPTWLEDRALGIVEKAIRINGGARRLQEVAGVLGFLDAYLRLLAEHGEVKRAFHVLKRIGYLAADQAVVNKASKTPNRESLVTLGIAEVIATFAVSIALGYRNHVTDLTRQQIERRVKAIRWQRDSSIYRRGFPSYYLSLLEWFKPRIEFEYAVERRPITPTWYLSEMVRREAAIRMVENCKELVITAGSVYSALLNKLDPNQRPWLAAAVMSREWEFWHKLETQFGLWEEKWNELSSERRLSELAWPAFDLNDLKTSARSRKTALLGQMSKESVLLGLLSRPAEFPDYAGQFLHTSGEEVLDALLTDDVPLLRQLFKPYLVGCFFAFSRLRPEVDNLDWRTRVELKIAVAPLLDLMSISGYAKVLADYHGDPTLWQAVTAAWDEYLASQDQPTEPALAAAVSLTESGFEIPHRAILRTGWERKVSVRLADVPRHEERSEGAFMPHTVIDHESEIVRLLATDRVATLYDGIDVFIYYYMRSRQGGVALDFGRTRRSLSEALNRRSRKLP